MTIEKQPLKDYTAPPERNDYLIFFALAIPILIADQISKLWVEANLTPNVKNYVWEPFLSWSHVHNTGGTFGMFPGQTWIFAALAFVVAGGLIVFNFRHPYRSPKLRFALGMVFGGAMGNLMDRVRIGHVTDFIDIDVTSVVPAWVPHNIANWYIFNIADIFIIGAIIFMFYLIFFDPEEIEPQIEPQVEPTADLVKKPLALTASTTLVKTATTPYVLAPLPPAKSAEDQRKILLTGATIIALILLIWQTYKEEQAK